MISLFTQPPKTPAWPLVARDEIFVLLYDHMNDKEAGEKAYFGGNEKEMLNLYYL